MKYFKHSMYQGRKGDAWTYFECDDAGKPLRAVTYYAQLKRLEKKRAPVAIELPPAEKLHPARPDEFQQFWDTPEIT